MVQAPAQLGMFSNCGRSSGFAHSRRRLVNISSTGTMPSGLSRLPRVTKTIPGKLSRLLVNTLAPQLGQKFRSRPLPDWAMFEFDADPTFIAVCHCLDCKKSSGGEAACFFGVPEDDF